MGQYNGKRVVITGGTSGIGLATAKLLLEQGARVLVTGSSSASVDSAREELGKNAITVKSNAASLEDIDLLRDRAKTEFGTIDLLFLNAGITGMAPFEHMVESVYDELFTVNVKGPYFTAQRLAALMSEGSAIVLTTSVVNVKGIPMTSAYSATKAALRSITRTLAGELVSRGIRVNAVSPGAIDTSILSKVLPKEQAEQAMAQFAETNPMKRVGRSEEIAKAVLFLAFEATYTTGAELAVDGGLSQF